MYTYILVNSVDKHAVTSRAMRHLQTEKYHSRDTNLEVLQTSGECWYFAHEYITSRGVDTEYLSESVMLLLNELVKNHHSSDSVCTGTK